MHMYISGSADQYDYESVRVCKRGVTGRLEVRPTDSDLADTAVVTGSSGEVVTGAARFSICNK